MLEQGERNQAAYSDLLTEADAAADDAHVIAEEVKAVMRPTPLNWLGDA